MSENPSELPADLGDTMADLIDQEYLRGLLDQTRISARSTTVDTSGQEFIEDQCGL